MTKEKRTPKPEAIKEAEKNPGGWVYEICEGYDPNGAVPPEAILGAWQVDDFGKIVGEFKANPNYRAEEKVPGTENGN